MYNEHVVIQGGRENITFDCIVYAEKLYTKLTNFET